MAAKTATNKPASPNDGLTPAMRQYLEQKALAPDALLLFRMGDFYETFFEDAETAARVLGITLTARGKDRNGNPIPLAGIPYHALESYLGKLVRAGYKVAICEQTEDPKQARGVVKRDVVRIVTPGTLTDDALLEGKADNYLACIHSSRSGVGLAFVELSTGAFWVQPTGQDEVIDELVRLAPAELLVADTAIDERDAITTRIRELSGPGRAIPNLTITRRPPHLFDPFQAQERLRRHFGVVTLEGFGFDSMDASLCAAAVIIDYLSETQKTAVQHVVKLMRRQPADHLAIDQATWRSLEIERTLRSGSSDGSLLQAVDRTSSVMGARCLRRWLQAPLRDPAAIRERQDAIESLLSDLHRLRELRNALRKLSDVERIAARLGVGRASPRDLVALGQTLLNVDAIADLLTTGPSPAVEAGEALLEPGAPGKTTSFLAARCERLRGLRQLGEYLTATLMPDAPLTINEGGIIAAGIDAELDRLRSIGADGRQWLADYQAREIQRTGIPSLKVGYNSVFGYYIEITNTHAEKVPADYVRKQTVKNAERYITDELKKYETEVLTARDRANDREAQLFEQLRRETAAAIPALQDLATAVAEIDVTAGWAWLADERRYVRPQLVDDIVLEITDGRHPVLEQSLGEKFVPNDCHLGSTRAAASGASAGAAPPSGTLVVLTGPNMAGKSTYIRQVALLTLLAQTGSFVPARSMRFSPADRLFARIGASDEITRGQSTFMVEMTEAANILNNATRQSLVILDELGRGTSTFDGLSLAWAIAEQLVTGIGCRSLFATHYHELTQLETYLAGVVNCNVAVREWQDEIVFLYRIVRGGTDKSYGVHVAKLAGVPPRVIARSRELLAELESNFTSDRAAPRRSALRTRKEAQLMLFRDPMDDIVEELRTLDLNTTSPVDALKAIERWKSRLDGV